MTLKEQHKAWMGYGPGGMWWLYQGDGVYLYVLPCFPPLLIIRIVDTMERSDFTGIRHNIFSHQITACAYDLFSTFFKFR
jgi:4-amino-4-deoxy-L-arabinose transferase-like glycosyltransferase